MTLAILFSPVLASLIYELASQTSTGVRMHKLVAYIEAPQVRE